MSEIHPAPIEFSADELAADPILRFFHYAHLPPMLRDRSSPFCDLARLLIATLPRNAERSAALRKLLEAKDCAVRAMLP
jgi:hypothetical protein